MNWKRTVIVIAAITLYLVIATHNPPEWLKSMGYNQVLDLYGSYSARHAPLEWIVNPGLRSVSSTPDAAIQAVIPDRRRDYEKRLQDELSLAPLAIVECSALDAWHTTLAGQRMLKIMRPTTYRVVVFDGGHHLPTLGLEPDILLVPALRGVAVHSYMRDGMEVSVLQTLLEELQSPAVAVAVPRWALVKRPQNLETLTRRIIQDSQTRSQQEFLAGEPCALPKMSCYNGYVLGYVSKKDWENPEQYARRIAQLSSSIHKVYLAFNYHQVHPREVPQWTANVAQLLGVPVIVVNRPLKVSDLIIGR